MARGKVEWEGSSQLICRCRSDKPMMHARNSERAEVRLRPRRVRSLEPSASRAVLCREASVWEDIRLATACCSISR